ncbi:hypothetical protein V6N13_109985 [Hibiscus sabdariffa]
MELSHHWRSSPEPPVSENHRWIENTTLTRARKIRCRINSISLPGLVSDLKCSLNIVNSTAEEIRNSVKLKK